MCYTNKDSQAPLQNPPKVHVIQPCLLEFYAHIGMEMLAWFYLQEVQTLGARDNTCGNLGHSHHRTTAGPVAST